MSVIVVCPLLLKVFLSFIVSGKFLIKLLYPVQQSDQLLGLFPDDPVHIDQMLIRIIDHAMDLGVVLPDSEEQGSAAHKRLYIGFHLPEIFGQGFGKGRQQASLASHPRKARASLQRIYALLFLFFHRKLIKVKRLKMD